MKSCPSCQQVYPDDGPDFCTNDGTPLRSSAGQSYNPNATPSGQWQPPGAQAPPPGWQEQPPQGWGYPPPGQYTPGQYPPYGYASPPTTSGRGLSKAAMITGIGSLGTFILAVVLAVVGMNSGRSGMRDMLPIIGIFGLLALLAGITAVVLGIVTLSMANKNPAVSKVHGILAICFGAIPIILWFLGLANSRRF